MQQTWKFLNVSSLNGDTLHGLTKIERHRLYTKISREYSVGSDGINGLNTNDVTTIKPISNIKLGIFYINTLREFFPIIFFICLEILLVKGQMLQFIVLLISYLIISRTAHEWTRIRYIIMEYMGYKICYNNNIIQYFNDHKSKPCIIWSLHGTYSASTKCLKLVFNDLLNTQFSDDTDSIENELTLNESVFQGKSTIFVDNKDDDIIQLDIKNCRDIARLALDNNANVIVAYTFGNPYDTIWYDSFGVLKKISETLKMDVAVFLGNGMTPFPKRIPMCTVISDVIINEYTDLVDKTTNDMIKKYHNKILSTTQKMFDNHKSVYGWNKKSIKFV